MQHFSFRKTDDGAQRAETKEKDTFGIMLVKNLLFWGSCAVSLLVIGLVVGAIF